MSEPGAWLRRMAAVSAVVVLTIIGFGVAGATATAGTGIARPAGPLPGVQHSARVVFSANGCQYAGTSDHRIARTEILSGNCDQTVYVRATICTAAGSCMTTPWLSGRGRITYIAPSGHTIRTSFHRGCATCAQVQINH